MHTKHFFLFLLNSTGAWHRQLNSSKHIIDQNDHITSGFRCKSTSEPSRGVINPHTWFFLFSTSTQNRHADIFGGILFVKYCKISNSIPGYAGVMEPCRVLTLNEPSSPDCIVETNLVPPQQTQTFERLPLGRDYLTTAKRKNCHLLVENGK